ncbi:hypothetical protein F8388_001207 [Cannabis sativa]|uniref:Uncharacterized protein n=1 Tax=Cannabis sativa TaxID=3483 RepID=A0A7J6GGT6_CANSA|nr:hypothetical protein F8388_001207 [Cannabis sativa]
MEKGKTCSAEKPLVRDKVSGIVEASKRSETKLAPQKHDANVILGDSGINEEHNRGKRRMVEDGQVMGLGKLQKTVSPSYDAIWTQKLFDVPITFQKETDGIEGGPSFVFGPSQQTIPKAQRRKMAVKKDGKNRKSKIDEEDQGWQFTGFYGDPDPNQRSESWKLLTRIGRMYSGPWVIGGDFNEILRSKEKLGGQPKQGS